MFHQLKDRYLNRAARRAALFALSAAVSSLTQSATCDAKMLQERLALITATGTRTIDVEVAATQEDMAMGLMFRTALADSQGMLFPSPAPRETTMWMRNTYIPLDMVFIRADGVVHRIEAMTEPLSEAIIGSKGDVLAVLELAGGAAARLGLVAGDRVDHRIFSKKP
jgi:uncharacterized protein